MHPHQQGNFKMHPHSSFDKPVFAPRKPDRTDNANTSSRRKARTNAYRPKWKVQVPRILKNPTFQNRPLWIS